jgi:hypothetical protein
MLRPVTAGVHKRIWTFLNVALALLAVVLCAVALQRLHVRHTSATGPLDRKISEIRFDEITFEAALDYFRRISNTEFRIDWDAIEASGTYDTTTVSARMRNVTPREALESFLDETNSRLGFEVEGNVVRITTRAALPRVVRVYYMGDLLPRLAPPRSSPAPYSSSQLYSSGQWQSLLTSGPMPTTNEDSRLEDLARTVAGALTRDDLVESGGHYADVWPAANQLIILHSREGHRKIESLLRQMRAADALRPWRKPPDESAATDVDK